MLVLWHRIVGKYSERKLYYSFLLSLCAILILSTVAFPMIYRWFFVPRYAAKVEGQVEELFEKSKQYTDSILQQFHQIANLVSSDYIFSSDYINKSVTSWSVISSTLKKYQNLNPALFDILYINQNTPYIYSSGGMNNPLYYPISRIDLYGKEIELSKNTFIPGKNSLIYNSNYFSDSIIEYVVPIMYGEGALIFQIYSDVLMPAYGEAGERIGIALINQDGDAIYHPGQTDEDTRHLISQLDLALSHSESGESKYSLEMDSKCLYVLPSEYANVAYLFTVPDQFLMQEINSMNHLFTICMAAILLVCAVLALFLARRSYEPILRMTKVIRQIQSDIPVHLDETEAASYTVQALSRQTFRLEREVMEAVQARLLRHLLNRRFRVTKEFLAACAKAGLPAQMPPGMIFLLSRRDGDESLIDPAIDAVEKVLGGWAECIGTEYVEQSSYVFLATFKKGIDSFDGLPEEMEDQLEEQLGQSFYISAGHLCKSWEDVYDSFERARAIGRLQASDQIPGAFCHILPQIKDENTYSYPKAEIEGLQRAIMQRNGERLEFLTQVLVDIVKSCPQGNFLTLSLCYDIAGIMIRTAASYNLHEKDIPLIMKDQMFYGPDDFEAFAERFTQWTQEYIKNHGDQDEQRMYEQILGYITNHIEDPELCVNNIGYHFNLSSSNVSHLFKANSGIAPSDYISNLRLEKTKAMLLSTDLLVGEIAAKMGYSQTSSFIRRFKYVYGITPGEYRQSAKSADGELSVTMMAK